MLLKRAADYTEIGAPNIALDWSDRRWTLVFFAQGGNIAAP
jgi:hypothetical protein